MMRSSVIGSGSLWPCGRCVVGGGGGRAARPAAHKGEVGSMYLSYSNLSGLTPNPSILIN
jgi:hypothetical protein